MPLIPNVGVDSLKWLCLIAEMGDGWPAFEITAGEVLMMVVEGRGGREDGLLDHYLFSNKFTFLSSMQSS